MFALSPILQLPLPSLFPRNTADIALHECMMRHSSSRIVRASSADNETAITVDDVAGEDEMVGAIGPAEADEAADTTDDGGTINDDDEAATDATATVEVDWGID